MPAPTHDARGKSGVVSFAAMFSTFLYLGFAFLFSKTGEKNSDVDRFLGVDPGNLARENRVRVRKRRRVLDALAALDHARDAQKAVFHDLAEELPAPPWTRTWGGAGADVAGAPRVQSVVRFQKTSAAAEVKCEAK